MQTRAAITHKMGGTSTNFNGEETTRRSAPRPSGAALRALSPLRCCYGRLIQADENLPNIWRRGWDSNPRTRLGVTHFPGVRLRPLGHLSINLNLLQPPGGIARGRKGTRGDPSDQIYGGAELEGSGTEGTAAGGGGTVCISLAALLGGAG